MKTWRGFKKYSLSTGVDFGSGYIKTIQLRKQKGRLFWEWYNIVETPTKGIEGGKIVSPAQVAARLAGLRKARLGRVNLAIDGRNVVIRQVDFPPIPSRELPEAIRWEAEKYIFMPWEETVVDYLDLERETEKGGGNRRILLVAVPREVLSGYLETLSALGLYPQAIEIIPLALIRFVNYFSSGASSQRVFSGLGEAEEEVLILDIGWRTTTLIIASRRLYRFSRTMGIGCRTFMDSVDKDPAGVKEKLSPLWGENALTYPGVQEQAELFLQEIKSTMDFYFARSPNPRPKINKLYITGGGARLSFLPGFLAVQLQIKPVEQRFFPSINARSSFQKEGPVKLAPLLSSAAGLALRGWVS